MVESNRNWLPSYCDPRYFLPAVQETVILFNRPPYLFQDFVGRAISFLQSEDVRKLGFAFDRRHALPCKWKCSDESLFGVDLTLYAYTGHYPFDKGVIGGRFNEGSLGAAVHHCGTNIDFGGSHVGYFPGPDGGTFGHIERPLQDGHHSTDCGYLMGLLGPFKQTHDDACDNILLFRPEGERVVVSIPNEFVQPSWSSHRVKLLVDIQTLAQECVRYDFKKPYTHKLAGRSLFYVHPEFLAAQGEAAAEFMTPVPRPIGRALSADYFNIFDSQATMDAGVPTQRLLPYMKYILSSKVAPYSLKAAVTNTNIEYNKLTDSVRSEAFKAYSFASFTGVFIDIFDEKIGNYVNLFQPVGISIKPSGVTREIEMSPAEIHDTFDRLAPANPVMPLEGVLGYEDASHVREAFTFRPSGG